MHPENEFELAEKHLRNTDDVSAETCYLKCLADDYYGPVAYYRLGEIYNRQGKIEDAQRSHKNAFLRDSRLARRLTNADHPHHDFEYTKAVQHITEECPLCRRQGQTHSVYNVITDIGFVPGFDPIKTWKYCDECHHIYTERYPNDLSGVLSASNPGHYQAPRQHYFPTMSGILNDILPYAPGNQLLEVGVGSGEMIAVANEMHFQATGIEIRPSYAKAVSETFGIPIKAVGFEDFETDQTFDVICMGDVIEHVTDPVQVLKKAKSLLNAQGVLWISTPNFESATAKVLKDQNPMWRTTQHIHYFSFASMKTVLQQLDFRVVKYNVSNRYVGSMEIIAQKQ
ncbi:MAG TPA: class I SAM-dependent methyltransferase [Bacillales bacterium]|nr:class I SAM-dependent methyltransferase [Bacillales bacterium]